MRKTSQTGRQNEEQRISIPKAAFSKALAAYRYFDKVDEGCGYDRLDDVFSQIQFDFDLTENELCTVQEWAHKTYYQN